ncbi:MAG: type II toxin-antitoxin system VapC family toxin [Candidatus Korobacteraceae bacterium]
MTAVDTNVLVRVITNDNKQQSARATAFLRKQDRVFVAKTVILEVEWVLRTAYGFSRERVVEVLRDLLNAQNVEIEDELTVLQALDWCKRGMDFADSLHLASAGPFRRFATFDVALRREALRLGASKPVAL